MTRIGRSSNPVPTGFQEQQPVLQGKIQRPAPQRDSFAQAGDTPGLQQTPFFAAKLQQQIDGGGSVSLGQSGESVEELQQLLNRTGIQPPLRTDGVFGSLTEAALRQLQADRGVKVDGILGPQSLQALWSTLGQDAVSSSMSIAGQKPPQSLQEVLSDHTVKVATLEDEKEREEHNSPIVNVRKLPTHSSPRPIMASTTRMPERQTIQKTVEESTDDLPQVSFSLPKK